MNLKESVVEIAAIIIGLSSLVLLCNSTYAASSTSLIVSISNPVGNTIYNDNVQIEGTIQDPRSVGIATTTIKNNNNNPITLTLDQNNNFSYNMPLERGGLNDGKNTVVIETQNNNGETTVNQIELFYKKRWTVIMYLNGDDKRLDPVQQANILRLATVGSDPQYVDVLILVDFHWSNTIYKGGALYYANAGNLNALPLTAINPTWQSSEIDMGYPSTLKRYIDFVMAKYPSDHYWLNISAHGDNWHGFSVDASSGNNIELQMMAAQAGDNWIDWNGSENPEINAASTANLVPYTVELTARNGSQVKTGTKVFLIAK